MDLRTVVTISALLFTTAESNAHLNGTNSTENSPTAQTSVTGGCLCPGDASTQTTSSPRSPTTVLGLLYIEWRNTCEGNVQIHLSNSSTPVCYSSGAAIGSFLIQECTKPCKGQVYLSESKSTADGYNITGSEVKKMTCQTLKAKCKAEEPDGADVRGQLKAYKVVTALLCCVLVVLFLIRFTRPTVKALQKRLSDKRQNRWIGPTQSHSVSYHRGKTAVKNNEGEKRLSYPALERLAVFDSREPSSNRNSDYNL